MKCQLPFSVLLALFLALLLGCYSCASGPGQHPISKKDVGCLLREIDPWPDYVTNYSKAAWNRLISAARFVQLSSPQSVGNALREFQEGGTRICHNCMRTTRSCFCSRSWCSICQSRHRSMRVFHLAVGSEGE